MLLTSQRFIYLFIFPGKDWRDHSNIITRCLPGQTGLKDAVSWLMSFSNTGRNVTKAGYRDTLNTAIIKNVITVVLCISINYVNGALVHIFKKHQVWIYSKKSILHAYMCVPNLCNFLRFKQGMCLSLCYQWHCLFSFPPVSQSFLSFPAGFQYEP